jgi:hypothetical protein
VRYRGAWVRMRLRSMAATSGWVLARAMEGVAWLNRVRGVRSRAVAAEQKVRRVGVACGELDMGGGCDLIWRLDLADCFILGAMDVVRLG